MNCRQMTMPTSPLPQRNVRRLAVSTQRMPEICQYADSGKILVTERAPAADGSVSGFRFIGRPDAATGYRDGE